MNEERNRRIKELHDEGKSYNEIKKLLNVSKGTISYHCSELSRTNHRKKCSTWKKGLTPLQKKISRFIENNIYNGRKKSKKTKIERALYLKIYNFLSTKNYKKSNKRKFLMAESPIQVKEVLEKFGNNPACYLTGAPIDLSEPSTYSLDHIIPASRGGLSTLDNMGLTTQKANQAKGDMTPQEFLDLCKAVVANANKIAAVGFEPTLD